MKHFINVKSSLEHQHPSAEKEIFYHRHKIKIPCKDLTLFQKMLLEEHEYDDNSQFIQDLQSVDSSQLKFYYLDADGDWIVLATSDHLDDALAYATQNANSLLKVRIIHKTIEDTLISNHEEKASQSHSRNQLTLSSNEPVATGNDLQNETSSEMHFRIVPDVIEEQIHLEVQKLLDYLTSRVEDTSIGRSYGIIHRLINEHGDLDEEINNFRKVAIAAQDGVDYRVAYGADMQSLGSNPGLQRIMSWPGAKGECFSESIIYPTSGFTSICLYESADRSSVKIFWIDKNGGTFGSMCTKTGNVSVILLHLSNPSKIALSQEKVFIIEEGEPSCSEGRLSFWNLKTNSLHVLLCNLHKPSGLHIGIDSCVYFTDCSLNSLRCGYKYFINVWFLPGAFVDQSLPGPNNNTYLSEKKCILVSFERIPGHFGYPTDIAVSQEGIILLSYTRYYGSHGGIEAFFPLFLSDGKDEKGRGSVFVKSEYSLDRRFKLHTNLSPVKSMYLCQNSDLIYAGCGCNSNGKNIAVGLASPFLANVKPIYEGFACSVVMDINDVIFYSSCLDNGSVRMLSRHSPALVDKISKKLSKCSDPIQEIELIASYRAQEEVDKSLSNADPFVFKHTSETLSTVHKDTLLASQENDKKSLRNGGKEKSMNVQIILRCRPLFQWERNMGAEKILSCSGKRVFISPVTSFQKEKHYSFDKIYDEDKTQEDIYQESIAPIVLRAMEGFKCTIFAYGQTGSGKTYTMEGILGDPIHSGIIPRSIHTVFSSIKRETMNCNVSYKVSVSHLEIYNEELSDLLQSSEKETFKDLPHTSSFSLSESARKKGVAIEYRIPKRQTSSPGMLTQNHRPDSEKFVRDELKGVRTKGQQLKLMKDDQSGMQVRGLSKVEVKSAEEIFSVLEKSIRCRRRAETLQNKESTRSHSIFSIFIERNEINKGNEVIRIGQLNLVDLCGSENYERAGAIPERQREAAHISQGLLALGRVIKALVHKWPHIPYRESKLTRLLEDSLGGNAMTTIILSVSSGSIVMDETVSTLNYATLAMKVKNRPKINEVQKTKPSSKLYKKNPPVLDAAPVQDDSTCVQPWESSIPIKQSRSNNFTKRSAISDRMYHLPTAEWKSNIMENSKLTNPILVVLREIFGRYDSNADGYLSSNEVRKLYIQIYEADCTPKLGDLSFNDFANFFEACIHLDPLIAKLILLQYGYSLNLERLNTIRTAKKPIRPLKNIKPEKIKGSSLNEREKEIQFLRLKLKKRIPLLEDWTNKTAKSSRVEITPLSCSVGRIRPSSAPLDKIKMRNKALQKGKSNRSS